MLGEREPGTGDGNGDGDTTKQTKPHRKQRKHARPQHSEKKNGGVNPSNPLLSRPPHPHAPSSTHLYCCVQSCLVMTPCSSMKMTQLLFVFTTAPFSSVYSLPKLPTIRTPSFWVAHSSFMPLSTSPSPSGRMYLHHQQTKTMINMASVATGSQSAPIGGHPRRPARKTTRLSIGDTAIAL